MTAWHRRLRRALRDRESGASTVELALYAPLLMLITFLLVQFALSWYGTSVANAAAREGARVARQGGTELEARDEATEYAAAVGGPQGLTDVVVEVRIVDGTVTTTVRGHAMELIPGFAPTISSTVVGPVEQFRPDR